MEARGDSESRGGKRKKNMGEKRENKDRESVVEVG